MRAGPTSHNAIAAELNERNVRTARGDMDAWAGGGQSSTLSAAQAPEPRETQSVKLNWCGSGLGARTIRKTSSSVT
jgi:hypothetical protein